MSTLHLGTSLSLPSFSSSPSSLSLLGTSFRFPAKFFPLFSEIPNHFKNYSLSARNTNKISSLKNPRRFHSRITCSAEAAQNSEVVVKEKSVSVILLAGGTGKRMGASMPKQYLPLLGQPIALYR